MYKILKGAWMERVTEKRDTSEETRNHFTQEASGEYQELSGDLNYLYPIEMAEYRKMVSGVCDQMDYRGSMMYDCYPDKETVRRMAGSICCACQSDGMWRGDREKMRPIVEMMLCHEMDCRRQKKGCHRPFPK